MLGAVDYGIRNPPPGLSLEEVARMLIILLERAHRGRSLDGVFPSEYLEAALDKAVSCVVSCNRIC